MADSDLTAVLQLVEQLPPALERQDRAALCEIVGRLVALRAPMGDQWQQLAQIADGIGEVGLSRRAIDLHVEAAGGTDAALYQKAAFLAQSGAVHDADALLRSLPAGVPNPLANAYSRGIGALNLGRTEEARAHLERVTHERPQTGSAWLGLAMAADLARDPALVARVVGAERGIEQAAPAERAPYYYALGKAYADCGDHARAFAACARGAREMKALVAYDRAADRAGAVEAVHGYSAARIAAIARQQREPTARTIFATGLPRSGTTLVEQILTSHSAVGHGAEFGGLAMLAREVGGPAWPALAGHVGERGAAPAAQLWHHWLDERFAARARVVDKSVDSSRYLGLAAALLPDAPLVWTTRDPLDRAWSCFRTNFLGGAIAWSYDLEDIALHFRLEDELLRQWQQILGDRLLVVSYEALVSDPEAGIRRILAHCGLSEEPQVFAPHANPRPVATASMVQVRRPIGREAIGSGEPYREFLAPFLAAYTG